MSGDHNVHRHSKRESGYIKGIIEVNNIYKTFRRQSGEKVRAINGLSITVASGDFLVLLGPSGCGKTTLLRAMAGLESIESGSIIIADKIVANPRKHIDVRPENRNISMMFQSYALWPHMTVGQNVEYPLLKRGTSSNHLSKTERAERVKTMLRSLGIEELSDQHPGQISGGQQQRVALARALVSDNSIVFFDEPLSNLDAKVRESVRSEIKKLHDKLKFTAVYVTHDQEEAMALGSKIAVLQEGEIAQIGSPREIHEDPHTPYVARFMGSGNELVGTVINVCNDSDPGISVETKIGIIKDIPVDTAQYKTGDKILVFTRPEHWTIGSPVGAHKSSQDSYSISGQGVIEKVEYLGPYTDYYIKLSKDVIKVRTLSKTLENQYAPKEQVTLSIEPDYVKVFKENNISISTEVNKVATSRRDA